MALNLVPYTNAMRLGQGFNSYTQQICIDDAVVIDNNRAENTLLNDGTTMRILAQSQSKASAWTRQKEVVVDDRSRNIVMEDVEALPELESEDEEDPYPEEDLPDKSASEEAKKAIAVEAVAKDEKEDEPADSAGREADKEAVDETETERESTESAEVIPATEDVHPVASSSTDESRKPDVVPASTTQPTAPSVQKRTRAASVGGSSNTKPTTTAAAALPRAQKEASPGAAQAKPPPKLPTKTSSAAWSKLQKDIAFRKAAARKAEAEEQAAIHLAEKERMAELRAHQKKIEAEDRAEDLKRRTEDREEQRKIRAHKREMEQKRREELAKAIDDAAAKNKDALSMADMQKILKQNQFADRWDGLGENAQEFVFDPSAPRGPSQTVTYNSRFIDRLSDITDDMCISGALSIKAAKIGGSGRGSFIDSDKFKESDLTFYISVKVVNQTINFKDALQWKPVKKTITKSEFPKIYGDSFISGFQEGGEFNAVVSMKIMNKTKKTDIQAAAKVAFTTGPMSVEAEANVGIARENIESNTETTIQVSWCGGGHIKPMEQQWDIKSLMAAASRFPDLVADCPQRTHAILTKYDSLRSFVEKQPGAYSKMQYENAQIYTNTLMDTFMTYKALYKQISDQMFQVRQKTMNIMPWEKEDAVKADAGDLTASTSQTNNPQAETSPKKGKNGFYPYTEENSRFEASIGGLDLARKAIRRQMARIVNEVDEIERDPTQASDEDHQEPFQPCAAFEMRLPRVEIPEELRPSQIPLTGQRIIAPTQTEEERKQEAQRLADRDKAPSLYADDATPGSVEEEAAFKKHIDRDPSVGRHLKVTSSVGDTTHGRVFNNLDFIRHDWHIKRIAVQHEDGMVRNMTIEYDNGVTVYQGAASTGSTYELKSFAPGERIVSASVETGLQFEFTFITALWLYTNRGRTLRAEALTNKPYVNESGDESEDGATFRDDTLFKELTVTHYDCPLSKGTLKGTFGRQLSINGIYRLGFIWGDTLPEAPAEVEKLERRSTPSKWGQLQAGGGRLVGKHAISTNFGFKYPQDPKTLWALSEVRGTNNTRPVSWNMESFTTTTEGLTLDMALTDELEELSYSWLTLPDNEVNFQTGSVDMGKYMVDGEKGTRGEYQVTFTKPYYKTPATPALFCQTLDFANCGSMTDAKTRARVENLTETGFTLVVESWEGSTQAGNVWGYCVWDKRFDGIKVKAGVQAIESKSLVRHHMKTWEPDLGLPAGKRPVAIMTGITGLHVNIGDAGRFHVKSQYRGTMDGGSISFGTDAFTQSRWVEAMYIAILEE